MAESQHRQGPWICISIAFMHPAHRQPAFRAIQWPLARRILNLNPFITMQ